MSTLTVNAIAEQQSGQGVTVDSLLIKDGALSLAVSQKANTDTSSGLTLNVATHNNFFVTLSSGSNTLANPTIVAGNIGQTGFIIFIQPASGTGTITLDTHYETAGAGGASSLTLSGSVNQYDVVPYIIKSTTSILLGVPALNFG
jgi:hypothetical protein